MHRSNPLYCLSCLQEGRHSHKPNIKIEDVLRRLDKQWSDMREDYGGRVQVSKQKYELLKPVILQLEAEALAKNLLQPNSGKHFTSDLSVLIGNYQRFLHCADEVEKAMTECDLIKIIERQAHYEGFVAEMESLAYLMELSERDLLV